MKDDDRVDPAGERHTTWTEVDAARARELLADPTLLECAMSRRDLEHVRALVIMLERALAELDVRAARIAELEENADRMRTYREALEGLPPSTLKRDRP